MSHECAGISMDEATVEFINAMTESNMGTVSDQEVEGFKTGFADFGTKDLLNCENCCEAGGKFRSPARSPSPIYSNSSLRSSFESSFTPPLVAVSASIMKWVGPSSVVTLPDDSWIRFIDNSQGCEQLYVSDISEARKYQ